MRRLAFFRGRSALICVAGLPPSISIALPANAIWKCMKRMIDLAAHWMSRRRRWKRLDAFTGPSVYSVFIWQKYRGQGSVPLCDQPYPARADLVATENARSTVFDSRPVAISVLLRHDSEVPPDVPCDKLCWQDHVLLQQAQCPRSCNDLARGENRLLITSR